MERKEKQDCCDSNLSGQTECPLLDASSLWFCLLSAILISVAASYRKKKTIFYLRTFCPRADTGFPLLLISQWLHSSLSGFSKINLLSVLPSIYIEFSVLKTSGVVWIFLMGSLLVCLQSCFYIILLSHLASWLILIKWICSYQSFFSWAHFVQHRNWHWNYFMAAENLRSYIKDK